MKAIISGIDRYSKVYGITLMLTERCCFYMRPEILLASSIQNRQVSTIYILQSLQLQTKHTLSAIIWHKSQTPNPLSLKYVLFRVKLHLSTTLSKSFIFCLMETPFWPQFHFLLLVLSQCARTSFTEWLHFWGRQFCVLIKSLVNSC